jgi:hypothetical protein
MDKSLDTDKPIAPIPSKAKPPRNPPQQAKFNIRGNQVKSLPNKVHKTGGRGR